MSFLRLRLLPQCPISWDKQIIWDLKVKSSNSLYLLLEIEGIKVAKQQQKAEAKRKATPVIGDLHPLMDALPELSDLMTLRKFPKHHKIQVKKRVPTNFNQMNSAQKSKALVEEIAQFHKTISDPLFKANPLAVISEHLSKRLMQEREGEPL
uniref:Uncharacterized protein n=1 Tax=Anolis carolinensis TaxID=28377 RepID=G1KJ73_ANOCA